MIGDLEKKTRIVRYTQAQADELAAEIKDLGVGSHIIRTQLVDYAREISVMIAYTDRPGFEVIPIRGRVFDAYDLADKILACEI
jgi:hypothetical protein